jgi:hypothetical protein
MGIFRVRVHVEEEAHRTGDRYIPGGVRSLCEQLAGDRGSSTAVPAAALSRGPDNAAEGGRVVCEES